MKTLISNIQRFSLDDGPGIRTTVFFKGCNLKCAWCHNPECISFDRSLQYTAALCVGCRKCSDVCPGNVHFFDDEGVHHVDHKSCLMCGNCVRTCLEKALTINGTNYSSDELLEIILKDRSFYESSHGGVTFSGGDPILQADFLSEILQKCKAHGVHTAVDTAGNVDFKEFEKVIPYTDLFLYDIKAFSENIHLKATQAGNTLIKENLKKLSEAGGTLIIRIPVINEYTANLSDLEKIADFLSHIDRIELIQLLPYHNYGAGKYETLGMKYKIRDFTPPDELFMEKALNLFLDRGLNARVS